MVCLSVVEEPHEGRLVSLGVMRHEKEQLIAFYRIKVVVI